jgi:hypothetical protein
MTFARRIVLLAVIPVAVAVLVALAACWVLLGWTARSQAREALAAAVASTIRYLDELTRSLLSDADLLGRMAALVVSVEGGDRASIADTAGSMRPDKAPYLWIHGAQGDQLAAVGTTPALADHGQRGLVDAALAGKAVAGIGRAPDRPGEGTGRRRAARSPAG